MSIVKQLEHACDEIDELETVTLDPDLERELQRASYRLKKYAQEKDRTAYLRALTDALMLYKSLIVPALQKQQLLRLKTVLGFARLVEQSDKQVELLKTASDSAQEVQVSPAALAHGLTPDASRGLSGRSVSPSTRLADPDAADLGLPLEEENHQ